MTARLFRTYLVRPVLEHLRAEKIALGPVLDAAGLDAGCVDSPSVDLTLSRLHAFLDAAAKATPGARLGIDVGLRLSRHTWDVLQFSCLSSPTLAHALAQLPRLITLLNDHVEMRVESDDEETRWEHRIPGAASGLSRHGNELMVVALARRCRDAVGEDCRPERAWFAHGDSSSAPALRRVLGCRQLTFGAGVTGLAFARKNTRRPLRTADPALLGVLERLVAYPLELRRGQRQVPAQVCRFLEGKLEEGVPPLRSAAKHLAMSERSLQRALGEEGTTYRDLLDQVRRVRARQGLSAGLSLPTLAARLGYAEVSALSRAFRRWQRQGWAAEHG